MVARVGDSPKDTVCLVGVSRREVRQARETRTPDIASGKTQGVSWTSHRVAWGRYCRDTSDVPREDTS